MPRPLTGLGGAKAVVGNQRSVVSWISACIVLHLRSPIHGRRRARDTLRDSAYSLSRGAGFIVAFAGGVGVE